MGFARASFALCTELRVSRERWFSLISHTRVLGFARKTSFDKRSFDVVHTVDFNKVRQLFE